MAETTTPEQEAREDPRAWNDNRERTPAAPVQTTKRLIKKPGFTEKLSNVQPSKKVMLGMMVAAAVLTMLVGFRWGGWVTGSGVQKQVATESQNAITLRLAPMCVAQFNLDPQRDAKLTELKAITSSYTQADFVRKQGWATMPGEASPDSKVATACAKLLIGG